jgi:hypothetical protein
MYNHVSFLKLPWKLSILSKLMAQNTNIVVLYYVTPTTSQQQYDKWLFLSAYIPHSMPHSCTELSQH